MWIRLWQSCGAFSRINTADIKQNIKNQHENKNAHADLFFAVLSRFGQAADHLGCGCDVMHLTHSAAAEYQSVFSVCRVKQSLGQAVRRGCRVADLRHTAEAMLHRDAAMVVGLLHERGIDGACRKACGALDNPHILWLS